MIIGMGLDIVDVSRMEKLTEESPFMRRFLHPQEYAEIMESRESRAVLLASRFAVKEAFGKATGKGLRGLSLPDIQLDHDEFGRPFLRLHGTAAEAVKQLGVGSIHVSLSHESKTAAAVVLFES